MKTACDTHHTGAEDKGAQTWFARWRKRMRNESGALLVEYTIAVPFLFLVFFVAVEFSYLKVREVALDRAVDRSFRELRLGLIDDPTHEKMKTRICADQLSFLLPNCDDNLVLEVRRVPEELVNPPGETQPRILDTTQNCIDATDEDFEPKIEYTNGGQNDLMLARACLIQRSIFPVFQLVNSIERYDSLGNFALISIAAFVNEPT